MGGCADLIAECKFDFRENKFIKGLDVSDDEIIRLLRHKISTNNVNIINKIKDEIEKVVPLLKKKLDEQ